MTAIHAQRLEPFLGEWQLREILNPMHPAPILLREEPQSVTEVGMAAGILDAPPGGRGT